MKLHLILGAAFTAAIILPAQAQQVPTPQPRQALPQAAPTEPAGPNLVPGEFSANVTLATDYAFRGISQTDEQPAIQGGFDWSHDAGPYLGVWASNVDFNDNDQASTEMDFFGGFAGEYRNISYDIGAIYYLYPGADTARDYDYWEIAAAASYSPLANMEAGISYNYSPDYFNESGAAHFVEGTVAYEMGGMMIPLTLSASGGHQWIEDNAIFGTPDYWVWSAEAATQVEGFDLALTYVNTDLEENECAGTDNCDWRMIFSAGREF